MTDKVFNEEIDALKADIANLRDDIAKLADAVVGAADEKIKEAREQMNEQARGSREDFQHKVDEALDRSRRTLDDLDEHVREHPVGSLMTAFGIGLLIAMLLGSGGRR